MSANKSEEMRPAVPTGSAQSDAPRNAAYLTPGTSRADPWSALRQHTAARIALGRSGASLRTQEVLAFSLAHAQARDAVHAPLDVAALREQLRAEGWPLCEVRSAAGDRAAYLARPDWGRRLREDSRAELMAMMGVVPSGGTLTPGPSPEGRGQQGQMAHERFDVVFVISDGLSARAVQGHALPLLARLRPMLAGLKLAPLVIATQARVALSDEVGELLCACIAISLIGERPGLSSPDSLGAYLTYSPRLGNTDEARNCVSNIRPQGLGYDDAAQQIAALIRASLHARLSGVALAFDPAKALAQDPSQP